MKYALVTTTINVPVVIADYIRNAERHHIRDLVIIVVGDRKSPPQTAAYLSSLASPYPIEYLDVERQTDYLGIVPTLRDFLPFDSVQRRNVGYLFAAWEYSAKIIIAVDDDNFPIDDVDFFGGHGVVGTRVSKPVVAADNGWFNSCWLLESAPSRVYYHRGYPVSKRNLKHGFTVHAAAQQEVMVNVGLWLGDPDVDTISRLDGESTIMRMNTDSSYLVAGQCLFPFNSQNTAFAAGLLPCIYLPAIPAWVKTPVLKGNNNFRYDDIWMSFFTKLCLDAVGGGALVGHPLVEQRRNKHDLFLDLEKELIPMRLTDILADDFSAMAPKGGSIAECYGQVIESLDTLCQRSPALHDEERALMQYFISGMRLWLEAVSRH